MRINRTNFWSRNNYFWKVPISHIIQNYWKKLALLWALQFQFNSETYPIRQLLSLKLPMDSKYVQASSLKNISVPNVRRNFHIHIARPTDNKNVNMMFYVTIWMWMSPLTYWNLNSSSKILVLQWLLGFMLVYCSQKVKWYTFPKRFA